MKMIIAASVAKATLLAAIAIGTMSGVAESQLAIGFNVVDSDGHRVGPVIGSMQYGNGGSNFGATAVAAVTFQGKLLPVYVLRSTFEAAALLFTSSDCTGQPFGDPSGGPFLATGISADNTLYYESGPSQPITVQSVFSSVPGTSGCTTESYMVDAVPMSPAIDLNKFTPPFRVVRGR